MRRLVPHAAAAATLLLAACAGAPAASSSGEAADPAAGRPGKTGAAFGADDSGAPPQAAGAAPFTALAARFISRALRQERAGELRRALDSWSVVAALRPETTEPRRRVADLTQRLKTESERRYREGLARLQEGKTSAARRELLLALVADPDNAAALEALKNRLEPDATTYTVTAGESFETIANRFYGDPGQAAIVALINNLDPAGKPDTGTVLSLPSLASPAARPATKPASTPDQDASYYPEELPAGAPYAPEPAPARDKPAAAGTSGPAPSPEAASQAEEQLAQALRLFRESKFEEAAAAAGKLAGKAAVGARARELAGKSWFAIGDAALKQDRFAEAAAAYKKAERDRADVPAALAAVERRKREKAEELYNAGVRFFIDQKLDEAIGSWAQTLELNPEHPKAPRDIEKARELRQKLKEIH